MKQNLLLNILMKMTQESVKNLQKRGSLPLEFRGIIQQPTLLEMCLNLEQLEKFESTITTCRMDLVPKLSWS